jgi:hypothetical protein
MTVAGSVSERSRTNRAGDSHEFYHNIRERPIIFCGVVEKSSKNFAAVCRQIN